MTQLIISKVRMEINGECKPSFWQDVAYVDGLGIIRNQAFLEYTKKRLTEKVDDFCRAIGGKP